MRRDVIQTEKAKHDSSKRETLVDEHWGVGVKTRGSPQGANGGNVSLEEKLGKKISTFFIKSFSHEATLRKSLPLPPIWGILCLQVTDACLKDRGPIP